MSMKKIISIAVLLSWMTTAGAATGSSSNGAPAATHFISYSPTGIVYVYFDVNAVKGIPSCVAAANVGSTYNYVFDSTTPGGKSMLAGIIAAHSSGVAVWFTGTGACDVVAGMETLGGFHTSD
jgi:hypothetical protein